MIKVEPDLDPKTGTQADVAPAGAEGGRCRTPFWGMWVAGRGRLPGAGPTPCRIRESACLYAGFWLGKCTQHTRLFTAILSKVVFSCHRKVSVIECQAAEHFFLPRGYRILSSHLPAHVSKSKTTMTLAVAECPMPLHPSIPNISLNRNPHQCTVLFSHNSDF